MSTRSNRGASSAESGLRVRAPSVRFPVDPGDISPDKAARRLHVTLEEFKRQLPDLLARGFPAPDQTTGNFDLGAIDRWRQLRHPRLYPELTGSTPIREAEPPRLSKLERFREAEKRSRHG